MLFTITAVTALGGLSYWLGLWDRPKFQVREYLLESHKELYAIVATSTDKNFASVIPRILEATKNGIANAGTTEMNATKILCDAAVLYDAPQGASCLSVGLFFDDPHKVGKPRWAMGWAVATSSFAYAQALATRVQKNWKHPEPICAVRLGPGPVLTARIPWRHLFTPMLAPMLHWKRGMEAYKNAGFKSQGPDSSTDGSVCCEIYVTGANDSRAYIDYTVLMGDTKNTWNDVTFPADT